MAICRFCQQRFRSEQGVKAHMKRCDLYLADKRKNTGALGSVPKAAITSAATLPVHEIPPIAAPDVAAPLREFVSAMNKFSTKPATPQTSQQQRRTILQAAKERVIDRYRTPSCQVNASMRGGAKLAIERELASLPLEELPFEEVCEFAAAVRDGCYGPTLTRQTREATRQRVEEERRHKKEVEALGALLQADRRKMILIQQASHQTQAFCVEKTITGWAHLSVLGDIESRLEVLLTGDEPILEAQAIVRAVLEARFAEAEATLAAARAKATERWYEEVAAVLVLGAILAAPLLAVRYPTHTLAIISWLERTFGLMPGAESAAPTPDTSENETPPPAVSPEARPRSTRRRKDPVAPLSPVFPWENAVGGEPGHAWTHTAGPWSPSASTYPTPGSKARAQ